MAKKKITAKQGGPLHVGTIDSFIPDALDNAKRMLKNHVKNGGSKYLETFSAGGVRHDYKHCMFTEFFCKEMNRLTIQAGLRCE